MPNSTRRGRPRRRWSDVIVQDLGIELNTAGKHVTGERAVQRGHLGGDIPDEMCHLKKKKNPTVGRM